jgi:alkylhydroperoxidase family enzyme
MNEAFDFIPGFLPTLLRSPAALQARERLARTIEGGHLTPRQRARIALIVAQQSGSDYCVWAQTCMARHAGLRWEEIVFSTMGTALGPRDAAIVRFAREVARTGTFCAEEAAMLARDPALQRCDIDQIVAIAALAILDNYLIVQLAPAAPAKRAA